MTQKAKPITKEELSAWLAGRGFEGPNRRECDFVHEDWVPIVWTRDGVEIWFGELDGVAVIGATDDGIWSGEIPADAEALLRFEWLTRTRQVRA